MSKVPWNTRKKLRKLRGQERTRQIRLYKEGESLHNPLQGRRVTKRERATEYAKQMAQSVRAQIRLNSSGRYRNDTEQNVPVPAPAVAQQPPQTRTLPRGYIPPTEEVLVWLDGHEEVPAVVKQLGGSKGDIPKSIGDEATSYMYFFVPGGVRGLYWARKHSRQALLCLLDLLYGEGQWSLQVEHRRAILTLPTDEGVTTWNTFHNKLFVERCYEGILSTRVIRDA